MHAGCSNKIEFPCCNTFRKINRAKFRLMDYIETTLINIVNFLKRTVKYSAIKWI